MVPPDTGIVHQVNLEYLANVVFSKDGRQAYPDTVMGTDSHTTMINGVGVVGWGVGGIEAEACMLGQPISMLLPQVVGFKLSGKMPEGATATDLVLTVTQMLRKKGVVGKFVEFYGPGVGALSLADRATISNMAPEYGATIGLFPMDAVTLDYLRLTNRSTELVELVEAYAKEQGLFLTAGSPEPVYTDTLVAGSRDRGAVDGRTEAAAGSHQSAGRQREFPDVRWARAPKTAKLAVNSHHEEYFGRGGGDCGDYQLHKYFESFGDDRGRAGGEESGGERLVGETVGEDIAGAGFEGCSGLPDRRGPDAVSRKAEIQSGWVRLHDLHREQRAAA